MAWMQTTTGWHTGQRVITAFKAVYEAKATPRLAALFCDQLGPEHLLLALTPAAAAWASGLPGTWTETDPPPRQGPFLRRWVLVQGDAAALTAAALDLAPACQTVRFV